MSRLKSGMLISGVAMFMAACGGGNGAGNAVDVSLFEWGVDPSPTSVTAGQVTFTANNEGGEAHELVIVKDVAPADLPVDEDGRVVEDQLPAGAFIGEIEEFAAGGTETATFDLTAGTYTIFCNILEEEGGQTESHFQNGMVNTIEVSG